MSYKIVILAVAVLGCQVNAQVGGFIRPFATGFTNGFSEIAKPFVQFGQSAMAPLGDYMSGQRFPYIPQMMTYPSKVVSQGPASAYEGFDSITSGFPGANYFQAVRPQAIKPPSQFFQVSSQNFLKPPRPFPVEEPAQINRPSSLLITSEPEIPKPDISIDEGFAGPSAQIQKEE